MNDFGKIDELRSVFEAECIEQGVPTQKFSRDELIEWLQQEKDFWATFKLPVDYGPRFKNEDGTLAGRYQDALQGFIDDANSDRYGRLEDFFKEAKSLRVLIAHGRFGGRIAQLERYEDKLFVAYALSAVYRETGNGSLEGHLGPVDISWHP